MVSIASYSSGDSRPASPGTVYSSPSEASPRRVRAVASVEEFLPVHVEPALPPIRSPTFWFHDGNIIIQVGLVQYRVHKSVVTSLSTTLASKLPGLRRTCAEICLSSDLSGIYVDEVSPEEFDVLLGLLYPHALSFKADLPPHDWFVVLSIASRLGIKTLRDEALAKAQKLCSPLDLVEYGRKFDIFECFSVGFRALCMRDDSLTFDEGERLGMETVIEIARAREMLAKGSSWSQIPFKHVH